MVKEYVTDGEYPTYFARLNGLRAKIASDLPLKERMCILDVATGWGYFAIEVAKREDNLKIMGIDITQNDVKNARKTVEQNSLGEWIKIVQMDASNMVFPTGNFDMVVNFLGLEDIHMTRGKLGIHRTFLQVSRVLKTRGYFCFTVMPPEEMETEAQKIEVALFSYICGATWLGAKDYKKMLEETEFRLIRKRKYCTGKKLSPIQAKTEVEFACNETPKIYGVETLPFEKVWQRFGKYIGKNGLGHYSNVVLFIAQKVDKVH